MIPIGEEHSDRRRWPIATIVLVAVTGAIALAVNGPGGEATADAIKRAFGLVPARLLANPVGDATTLVSYQFLHSGFLHVGTNLLFLWVFGRGLEHELRWSFLPFYLLCGVAAGLTSVAVRSGSDVTTIGASGAISGVMGAYLVLLPSASIRAIVLVPWLFIVAVLRGDRPIWDVPAWAVILTWFGLQIVEGLAPAASRSGVDHAAHVGGFLAGYLLIRLARGAFGLWPDEPTYERLLDRPAARGAPLPHSYVRARRMIQRGTPIALHDIEWVSRDGGYVDPAAIPGHDASKLVGLRLRETRYRYEPIRWVDVLDDVAALPTTQ